MKTTLKSKRSSKHARITHGSMLVEVVLCLMIGTSVLTLAIAVVHQTMQFSSLTRQHAAMELAVSRLERQLRDDIHQSVECQLESNTRFSASLPSGDRVRYSVDANRVRRELLSAASNGATAISTDAYLFRDAVQAEFDLESTEPKRVTLHITQSQAGTSSLKELHQVTCVLSRDVLQLPVDANGQHRGVSR